MNPNLPLCVDLDGTLLATDCLWESFVQGLKKNPFIVILAPFWLLRGKAYLKNRLASYADFEIAPLPENTRFLNWLSEQVADNRDLYLVSASDQSLVSSVADHFGIFREAIGSNPKLNLRGRNKARYLVERFGEGGFDYAGNEFPDLEIWAKCNQAIMVHPPARLVGKVPANKRTVIWEDRVSIPRAFVKAMRPHQWVKNLLVFVPLLAAHAWSDLDSWITCLLAFASISLCASGVYLLNDLADLGSDRLHSTKRNRPFAAGALPLYYGLIGTPFLLLFSLVIMTLANFQEGLPVLAVYFSATCLYSFWLKQVGGIDIVFLAGLYTVRLMLGGAVVNVEISEWLLAFSVFFFMSLAFAKRYSELFNLKLSNREKAAGRGYLAADLNLMAMLGSSSAYLSVMVLVLYVSGDHVAGLYQHPRWIYLVCPIMLAWTTRLWLLTHRGLLGEDPIYFAIKDPFSYLTLILLAAAALLAAPL